MELVKVGEKTYYLKNATNIGIYRVDDKSVYLIDTGNDKDAGKKILKIINEQGWQVKGIINTHSHADHIGGNQVIQERTNCMVYSSGLERCFTEYPILEPSLLYGGFPFAGIRNKFLLAKASKVTPKNDDLPTGLTLLPLPGHAINMIGVKTSDNVVFLADAVFSAETIAKYHIFYLYDVKAFLETLEKLANLDGALFIPAHCAATNDLKNLIEINRDKVYEVSDFIYQCCCSATTEEAILQTLFEHYHLTMDATQYVLIGSTVRSYLAYLCDSGKLQYIFQDNKLLWQQTPKEALEHQQ